MMDMWQDCDDAIRKSEVLLKDVPSTSVYQEVAP